MLELAFDNSIEARGLLTPRGEGGTDWIEALPRTPRFLGIWSGPEVTGRAGAPYRVGGYFVEPLESVVGLRPFDDTIEGTMSVEEREEPVPYAIFEIEKIARMMLHQSALAFEVLATPHWLVAPESEAPCREARRIVRRALTTEILEAFRERAGSEPEGDGDRRAVQVRELAMAVALGEGRVSLDLERLLEILGEDATSNPDRALAERLVDRVDAAAARLPESPTDYEGLDDWLVERRLEVSGARSRGSPS